MSDALLRSSVRDLRCIRESLVNRARMSEHSGSPTVRLHHRVMIGILTNSIPMLQAIQNMSPEQRMQARALLYVSKLTENIRRYKKRHESLYQPKNYGATKILMANDFERLFSALDNIIYALEKTQPAATVNHSKPAAAATPAALSASLNPFILWYKLCTDFFWASTSQLVPANTGPNAVQHEPKHLKGIDGGRQPNAQRTPRPGGAVLSLCR